MCGIAGVVRFDGRHVERDVLSRMTTRLEHRGPDDHGCWIEGTTGFGHRRLSIIDLGASRQPMGTPDGRFHLVFNGEIFNYRELRRRLDYPFTTAGDTETVLAAFAEQGTASVAGLTGQFAFAVHDGADGSVTLVRDRLGVLPLYYYIDAAVLVFASEIKAVLPAIPMTAVDEPNVEAYLAHRAVPAPGTLFRGIKKLEAGHLLRVSPDGSTTTARYWSLPADPPSVKNAADAVDEVEEALVRAVELALVADVPVGSLLSGGVDSSLIVAMAARSRGGGSIDTFSAGFDDERFDELPYARRVSQQLGTRHHEVLVLPADFLELWPKLTWHRDAPLSEPADVALFRLAELASEHVKVILSGEGSDELFAGYPKYRAEPWVARASAAPLALRRRVADLGDALLPAGLEKPRIALRALAASSEWERRRAWFAPFDERGRAAVLKTEPRGIPSEHRRRTNGDAIDAMLRTDIGSWLPDNLLERGDRMCMAAGVELRPPFLDHHLVELAFTLPSSLKVRKGSGKWVVKEVARRYLGPEIVERKKLGFRVPLDAWFRTSLRAEAQERLLDRESLARRLFEVSEVERLLGDHERKGVEHMRIWTLLCLEIWHDVFFRAAA